MKNYHEKLTHFVDMTSNRTLTLATTATETAYFSVHTTFFPLQFSSDRCVLFFSCSPEWIFTQLMLPIRRSLVSDSTRKYQEINGREWEKRTDNNYVDRWRISPLHTLSLPLALTEKLSHMTYGRGRQQRQKRTAERTKTWKIPSIKAARTKRYK